MNKPSQKNTYDVIVIGGGPAGMIAAGRAAELGATVLLLEKNRSLGKKLLITGGGRCNITNAEFDTRKFLGHFKESAKYLFSAFTQFGVAETLAFFNRLGLKVTIQAGKRAFPETNSAESVLLALQRYLKQSNTKVVTNCAVNEIITNNSKIAALKTADQKTFTAKNYILATGGKSHPETGSTGEGFKWLTTLGHAVREEGMALVPVRTKENWVKKLQGISLNDARVTIFQNETKQNSYVGKLLFTHFGLSGPVILNASGEIGVLLKYGRVQIELDLLPSMDKARLNIFIRDLFAKEKNKNILNVLKIVFKGNIAKILLELCSIDSNKKCHSITKEERLACINRIKTLRVEALSLLGKEKAVITAGGVNMKEIDFKTMRSKLVSNLYLTGDTLDINRPTGGYSLQLCWTTGYIAGTNAIE